MLTNDSLHRGMRDSQLIILTTGSTRGQLPAHSFASLKLTFLWAGLVKKLSGPRCLVIAPCYHDVLLWHSSVLCWELCSLKIFKIFSLNTQNKLQQGALCCLLSGSVCAVATAQPWESKCWTFILTLTISHFTITQLFAAYIFVNWFCYSQNALYHPLENIQIHHVSKICGSQIPMRGFYVRKDQEVKPGMMQSNKSDKQLLPSEDYLRFLVIDL